jgi:hypothetical protein
MRDKKSHQKGSPKCSTMAYRKIVGQMEYRFDDAVQFFGAKEVVYIS